MFGIRVESFWRPSISSLSTGSPLPREICEVRTLEGFTWVLRFSGPEAPTTIMGSWFRTWGLLRG